MSGVHREHKGGLGGESGDQGVKKGAMGIGGG